MSSVDNNAAESNNDATNVPNQDEATEAQEQPRLVVTIDEEQVVVEPGDLGDENLRADLIRRCEQAARTVEFAAEDLFAWPDLPRSILLQILHGLGQQARLRVGCDEAEHPNPFEAIVANLAGADDIQRCTASQRGAIEAAALFLPQDSWQAAASRIAAGLREAGVEGVRAPRIFKAIQNVAASPTTADAATAAADFHNALRATLQLAGHDPAIRYFQDDFYAWNGRYWQRLDNSELEARVTQHVQEAGQLSVTKKLIADVVTNLKGQTFLQDWHRQMPFWIEAEQTQPETGTPPLVVFENGLIDLQEALDGEIPWLYEHDVNCFSTVMLPYEYDPLATCPLWLETLAQIFPSEGRDDHRIEVLQEFMGLTFFPRDTRFETFLIFVGKGANGKSTILRTWEALLGPQNVTHVPLDALGGEFRLYDMQGKLANIASDMKRMDKWEEGRLKELTSGEAIQVNRKFKSPVTMVPTARLIFACNELPQISDRSEGIWRRIIAMPLNVQFASAQMDRQRAARLREELPGIFNWAIEGAKRLYAQNAFTRCSVCEQCAGEHRQHSDPFLQFVDEEVVQGPEQKVVASTLYKAYVEFCQNNGRKPKSSSEFGKQVLDLPNVSKQRQGIGERKWEYLGIGLRNPSYRPNLTLGIPFATTRRMMPSDN